MDFCRAGLQTSGVDTQRSAAMVEALAGVALFELALLQRAEPRAESDRTAGYSMDDRDLLNCRRLVAGSDGLNDYGPETVRLAQAR